MHPLVIVGGAAAAALLLFSKPSKTQKGLKNSGIGGAAKRTGGGAGVQAFPVGQVADSLAKIGTSIFGGAGTHAPVDGSIRPPGATGYDSSKIITSLGSSSSPTSTSFANVPSAAVVQTQIDGYDPNAASYGGGEASVTPEDFNIDTTDYSDYV